MSRYLILLLLILLGVTACEGDGMEKIMQPADVTLKDINSVSDEAWQNLSQKNFYFGHQSVGFNIIDGIRDIEKENKKVSLTIKVLGESGPMGKGIFLHSEVGRNEDPESKLADFSAKLENGIANNTDYAFVKFCYVDFTKDSDVRPVFEQYKKTYEKLSSEFPNTKFIVVTTPLTARQTGLKVTAKNIIKKIIGRPVRTYRDNIKRMEFNNMLLQEYSGKAPVFNLAAVESTYPDGKALVYKDEENQFPALIPEYTDDGGHLNEKGRKFVAEQFLIFLANLAGEK